MTEPWREADSTTWSWTREALGPSNADAGEGTDEDGSVSGGDGEFIGSSHSIHQTMSLPNLHCGRFGKRSRRHQVNRRLRKKTYVDGAHAASCRRRAETMHETIMSGDGSSDGTDRTPETGRTVIPPSQLRMCEDEGRLDALDDAQKGKLWPKLKCTVTDKVGYFGDTGASQITYRSTWSPPVSSTRRNGAVKTNYSTEPVPDQSSDGSKCPHCNFKTSYKRVLEKHAEKLAGLGSHPCVTHCSDRTDGDTAGIMACKDEPSSASEAPHPFWGSKLAPTGCAPHALRQASASVCPGWETGTSDESQACAERRLGLQVDWSCVSLFEKAAESPGTASTTAAVVPTHARTQSTCGTRIAAKRRRVCEQFERNPKWFLARLAANCPDRATADLQPGSLPYRVRYNSPFPGPGIEHHAAWVKESTEIPGVLYQPQVSSTECQTLVQDNDPELCHTPAVPTYTKGHSEWMFGPGAASVKQLSGQLKLSQAMFDRLQIDAIDLACGSNGVEHHPELL